MIGMEPPMGLSSGCVDGDCARYWRLTYWLMGLPEETKDPVVAGALWDRLEIGRKPGN